MAFQTQKFHTYLAGDDSQKFWIETGSALAFACNVFLQSSECVQRTSAWPTLCRLFEKDPSFIWLTQGTLKFSAETDSQIRLSKAPIQI